MRGFSLRGPALRIPVCSGLFLLKPVPERCHDLSITEKERGGASCACFSSVCESSPHHLGGVLPGRTVGPCRVREAASPPRPAPSWDTTSKVQDARSSRSAGCGPGASLLASVHLLSSQVEAGAPASSSTPISCDFKRFEKVMGTCSAGSAGVAAPTWGGPCAQHTQG